MSSPFRALQGEVPAKRSLQTLNDLPHLLHTT